LNGDECHAMTGPHSRKGVFPQETSRTSIFEFCHQKQASDFVAFQAERLDAERFDTLKRALTIASVSQSLFIKFGRQV